MSLSSSSILLQEAHLAARLGVGAVARTFFAHCESALLSLPGAHIHTYTPKAFVAWIAWIRFLFMLREMAQPAKSVGITQRQRSRTQSVCVCEPHVHRKRSFISSFFSFFLLFPFSLTSISRSLRAGESEPSPKKRNLLRIGAGFSPNVDAVLYQVTVVLARWCVGVLVNVFFLSFNLFRCLLALSLSLPFSRGRAFSLSRSLAPMQLSLSIATSLSFTPSLAAVAFSSAHWCRVA